MCEYFQLSSLTCLPANPSPGYGMLLPYPLREKDNHVGDRHFARPHSWWLLAYVLFSIMAMTSTREVPLQSDCAVEYEVLVVTFTKQEQVKSILACFINPASKKNEQSV